MSEEQKADALYRQRNNLAIAFCKAAIAAGWKAGRGIDRTKDIGEGWHHVVYVELPGGEQVSWHMAPSVVHLLDGLPMYEGDWDGTWLARHKNWPKLIYTPPGTQPAPIWFVLGFASAKEYEAFKSPPPS